MTQPLPFQREDVNRMHALKGRVLLANEPGLGKTFASYLYLAECPAARPAVIVCPKGLKLHWREQAREHFGMDVCVLNGTRPCRSQVTSDLMVLNYDILAAWLPLLASLKVKVLIADEAHYLGNLHAKRTRAFLRLARVVPRLVALSGTPLTNKPFELFPVLHALAPQEYPSPFHFGMKYCDAQQVFGRWRFSGARNLKELHRRLSATLMIRRTKAEVLKDLPAKTHTLLPLPIDNKKEYQEAEKDVVAWLAKTDLAGAARAARAESFSRFSHLKRLAAMGKMRSLLEWLDDHLAEGEHKVLVGAVHRNATPVIPTIAARYPHAVQIHGGTSEGKRKQAQDAFRKDPKVRVLVAQIKAAGEGLNLPEASTVLFAELPWTPGAVQQFSDRAHRLNSVNPVQVVYAVAEGTIEEKLCQIIERKKKILSRVLDGVDGGRNDFDLMDELARRMTTGGGR